MSKETRHRKEITRRDFLKLAALVSVGVIGGITLNETRPWLNYDQQMKQTWETLSNRPQPAEQMKELVRYATLAANGHNTQPWKFSIRENTIQIHPDPRCHLAVVDPNDREQWISLGCALENLLIGARASGYSTNVIYPDANEWIEVQLTPDTPQKDVLFDAIPLRQNTRSKYDGRPIHAADYAQIQNLPLEPGIEFSFADTREKIEMFLEYVNQGNLKQYADPAFIDELVSWIRFNKREALAHLDGLYSVCTGNPQVPRWFGKLFMASTKPSQQADADAEKLRSSAGAVVIASQSDDRTGWVRTGQVYERLALKLTSVNVKSAFLNQPIEIEDVRAQFGQALGIGGAFPQLLIRYGYTDSLPRSLRKPVEQVML
jgi:hypothetical protein